MSDKIYKAAIYLRLSNDDGDKDESYSISNQRNLIKDFIERNADIDFSEEFVDDGYSGANFERPAFKKMIGQIEKKKLNCVIVKDLSRFARDYIGSGYYLEKLFPLLGVRFISINDGIDYKVDSSSNTKLIMAFKNVLNDSYIHDISVKIRSQFEIMRKKGEYVGAFAVYGYKKSEEDKHKLVIDKGAAEIVKIIFNQRMCGISANAIANKLNLLGVPSPAEYKKICGSKFQANFQTKDEAQWAAKAITRILKNEIYTGTLIQGKQTTVNYKVKKIVQRPEDEWSIKKDAHEAIITKEQFDIVQDIIKNDTRVFPGNKEPYLFSGFTKCVDCKASMVRRTAVYKNKRYAYYMCSTNKLGLGCESHRISEDALYNVVLKVINSYIKNVSDLSEKLDRISVDKIKKESLIQIKKAEKGKKKRIEKLKEAIAIVKNKVGSKYETREAGSEICSDIQREIDKIEVELTKLDKSKNNVKEEYEANKRWIKGFSEYGEITEINRAMLANIVETIYIYKDKRVEIKFRCEDKYRNLIKLIESE